MPENDAGKITIRSEEDAWDFLKLALDDQLPEGITEISFENWPVLNVKLEGAPFHATISTKNMEGFIELQKNIYRSYALAAYHKTNTNYLSNDERNSLAFTVKVGEGSSEFMAALEEALKTFAVKMAEKMEPKHIMITVLGAGLLWAGTSCWQSYLENIRQQRDIQATTLAGEQEVRRMEIMAKALTSEPVLVRIRENSENTYNEMLKSFASADAVTIADKRLEKPTVKELTKTSRSKSHEVRIDGIYKIKKVDSSNPDIFKVAVFNTNTGDQFPAVVQDTFVSSGKNKARLQKAEWEREPVFLKINANDVGGQISGATIIGVEEVKPEGEG